MKKQEGYDLIGRYLDGDLPSEAAREFEALLEHDRELAEEVRSEQVIRETLNRDLAGMPVASNEPSALLLARLEAGSTAVGGAIGGATGGGVLGTIFGTVGGVTIVTTVGLIGLALGAIFFSESIETIETVEQPPGIETEADPSLRSAPSNSDISRPSVGSLETPLNVGDEKSEEENLRPPRTPVERFTSPSSTEQSTDPQLQKEDQVRALLERLQKEEKGEVPVIREDSVLKIRKDS